MSISIIDGITTELDKRKIKWMTIENGIRIFLTDKDITDDTLYMDVKLLITGGCVGCDKAKEQLETKGKPC